MKFNCIKFSAKALVPACAALAMLSPGAQAESQYGYSPSGTPGVTATAKIKIEVKVPLLILLRVGAATGVDTLTFSPVPVVNGAPTAATLGALTGDISDQIANWDGALPTFAAPATQAVNAYAWTNSPSDGQLGLSSAVDTALGTIAPSDITVVPTAGVGALPTHPGTTANNANIGTFAKNTLHSASWAYGVAPAALAAAPAGTYSQTTTYTATSL